MAGLFYIGAIECNNSRCESQILEYLLDLKLNSISNIHKFELISDTFPLLNLTAKYAGSIWKGLQYFLNKIIVNSSEIISNLIKNCDPDLQSHFFSDLLRIFKEYLQNYETISFKFSDFKVHEKCLIENCGILPCCTNETCKHSTQSKSEAFQTDFKHEDSGIRIDLLINSLVSLKKTSEFLKKKSEFIKLLIQGSIFPKIQKNCVKLLCFLSEFSVENITEIENIEANWLKNISPYRIIEITKKGIISGKNLGNLIEYCNELLISGVKYDDVNGIVDLIKSKRANLMCWLIIMNYFGDEFDEYVELINSFIYLSENASKKVKNNESDLRNLEVLEKRSAETVFLYELLKEAVYNKDLNLLEFWYGITFNKYLGRIVKNTPEIIFYHTLKGYIEASTMDLALYQYFFLRKNQNLENFWEKTNLLDIYHTFCMMPLYFLTEGCAKTERYIEKTFDLLKNQGFPIPELNFYSGKAIKAQLEGSIKGLLRMIFFLKELGSKDFSPSCNFILGYNGLCIHCGDHIEKFCFSCGKLSFPTIFPKDFIDPCLEFSFSETISLKFSEIKYKPTLMIEISPFIIKIGKDLQKIEKNNHSCLDLMLTPYYSQMILLLKILNFSKDISIQLNSLILPSQIASSEYLESISGFRLYSKLMVNKLLANVFEKEITPRLIKICAEILLWPCPTEICLDLSISGLKSIKNQFDLTCTELFYTFFPITLINWAISITENPGFFNRIQSEIEVNTTELLILVQPHLIISQDYEISKTLMLKFCKEIQSSMLLFYTNNICEIVYSKKIVKLKTLDNFANIFIKGVNDGSITIKDIFARSIDNSFKVTILLLLCKFGLGNGVYEWVIHRKLKNFISNITLPVHDMEEFKSDYGIIFHIFYSAETLSQKIEKSINFDWNNFFNLAQTTEVMNFSNEICVVNSLIGLANLCLSYLEKNEHAEYLSHKILSICSKLLTIDPHLMLQILQKVLVSKHLKEHKVAVLSLAFISRKYTLGLIIIERIFNETKNNEFSSISCCYFMCFFKFIKEKSKVFDKLLNFLDKSEEEITDLLFASLCEAVSCNFPILQYAALSIIPEIIEKFPTLDLGNLLFALNKASSLQTSRDNIKELSFPLGYFIDENIGKVGAIANLEENTEPNESLDLATSIQNCENLYCNSENVYFSKILMKNDMTRPGIDTLQLLYMEERLENREFPYSALKSLREWTEVLIRTYKIKALIPAIPLIKVNLELITVVLPEIFNANPSKNAYFCEYLIDFFTNSNSGHRRLMLKILERSKTLYNALPLYILLEQLIDLQEFPKALYLLENKIRLRIHSNHKRYSPELIEQNEIEKCKEIYSGLFRLRYIEAIPKHCKEKNNENEEIKAEFNNGNFLLLANLELEKKNIFYIGASWRIGKKITVEINLDIESIVAYVFNTNENFKITIEKARKFLIAKSYIRTAGYNQAYEHFLIQHIFENILITEEKYENGAENYELIKKRNEKIENKFEYREIVWRVSLVLYKKHNCLKDLVSAYRELLKNAILHKNFEYCKNLILEIKIIHRNLTSPLLTYYDYKYKFHSKSVSKSLKVSIKELRAKIQKNSETLAENGTISNITLSMKLSILYLKVKSLGEISNSSIKTIVETYLKKISDLYVFQRKYLEKGFYILANHFDNFLFFEITKSNAAPAILSAGMYIRSLKHGQAYFYHSMTRLLTLFFGICNTSTETSEIVMAMEKLTERLPLFVWADRLTQVISASGTFSRNCRKIIGKVLTRLFIAHPQQMAWFIFPLLDNSKINEDNRNKVSLIEEVINNYKNSKNIRDQVIVQYKEFFQGVVELSKKREKKISIPYSLKNFGGLNLALPIKSNFKVLEYDKSENFYNENVPGFTESPVLFKKIHDKVQSMQTKAAPVKIMVTGSDDKDRYFLCKFDKQSDMRKESRMITIFEYVNHLLSKDPDARRLRLRLPIYSILYVGSDCGIVEWVEGTTTLKSILSSLLTENKNKSVEFMKNIARGNHENKETWAELQESLRPNFHKYFKKQFVNCHSWHKARITYTRSLAAWSVIGYIIGLGDRHCENILMVENTAELVFIDFECIFNMGKILPKPEIVPFRLTPELRDAMGLFFEDAEFLNTCQIVLECLKNNKNCLLSQFESFVSDPLSMKILNPDIDRSDFDVKNTLKIVEARLDGKKKFGSREEFKSTRHQIEFLTKEATDPENLRVMFYGWMPWL